MLCPRLSPLSLKILEGATILAAGNEPREGNKAGDTTQI
jgi:hypothetical protein